MCSGDRKPGVAASNTGLSLFDAGCAVPNPKYALHTINLSILQQQVHARSIGFHFFYIELSSFYIDLYVFYIELPSFYIGFYAFYIGFLSRKGNFPVGRTKPDTKTTRPDAKKRKWDALIGKLYVRSTNPDSRKG